MGHMKHKGKHSKLMGDSKSMSHSSGMGKACKGKTKGAMPTFGDDESGSMAIAKRFLTADK